VLLNGSAAALAERLRALEMTRCWALMLGFDAPLGLPYDAAYVQGSALSWLARNSAKPGRAERESWVAHASPEWSEGRGDLDPMQVTRELTEAFDAAVGGHTPRASARAVRLWDAAAPIASLGEPYLLDLDLGLGLCGDWCLGPRVEAAFLSGLGLAEALLVAAEAP
jgi:predicted NAD/FAD-dependent oxidoreductase